MVGHRNSLTLQAKVAAIFCTLMLPASAVVAQATRQMELVSVTASSNEAAGDHSYEAVDKAVSADGRFVVFQSDASTLVPGDRNNTGDVFVRDRQAGLTERVSVSTGGLEGNLESYGGFSISANGRYVAFSSAASNLVRGDRNNSSDVFVRDRETGQTQRVSVASSGAEANLDSSRPSISADGRYVAFESAASNLVPGDGNGARDVFVRDRETGQTERASVDLGDTGLGSTHASISGDGQFVAFVATDYSDDGAANIWLRDRKTGVTELISVDGHATPVNQFNDWPDVNANGRYVVYQSAATNLVPGDSNDSVDIFLRDRVTGTTELVSVDSGSGQANGASWNPSISADGRYVAFESPASNLVPGDTNARYDIFVRDRQSKSTERHSVAADGGQADGNSFRPSLSADGRYVVFDSVASNLVSNDFNSDFDVFIEERAAPGAEVARFTVKPDTLAFGPRPMSTRTTLSFWLRNRGTTPLPVASIGLFGADRAMFTVSHRCGSSVAAGGRCQISVTFEPTSTGSKSVKLRVTTDGGVSRTRELTGTGV